MPDVLYLFSTFHQSKFWSWECCHWGRTSWASLFLQFLLLSLISFFVRTLGTLLQRPYFYDNCHLEGGPPRGGGGAIDSTAISIFVVILVEMTNTVFVNSTNITTNIETTALSRLLSCQNRWSSYVRLTWVNFGWPLHYRFRKVLGFFFKPKNVLK